MATFTAGNGTIQATTLENAALVAAQLLQDAENQIGVTANNIAVSYFSGDNTVTVDATLPVTIGRSGTNGQMVIIARDYLFLAEDPHVPWRDECQSTIE